MLGFEICTAALGKGNSWPEDPGEQSDLLGRPDAGLREGAVGIPMANLAGQNVPDPRLSIQQNGYLSSRCITRQRATSMQGTIQHKGRCIQNQRMGMEESVEPIAPPAKPNIEEWCVGNSFPERNSATAGRTGKNIKCCTKEHKHERHLKKHSRPASGGGQRFLPG
ncbi:hypothetical protein AV530_020083 [Patagioenas fasciata monilis]|uniref:Uncharacterized protein n=1 Tax=Patagioenas fasciata monilis TaxID=372326 RepID=A0A1V4JIE3_PATFA|nr:hypothetical protein AV530_020083 [Patagioenas fasciata monilis]